MRRARWADARRVHAAHQRAVVHHRLSRPHTEDLFSFERSSEGALTRFGYRASLTQRYEGHAAMASAVEGASNRRADRVQSVCAWCVIVGSLGDTLDALKLGAPWRSVQRGVRGPHQFSATHVPATSFASSSTRSTSGYVPALRHRTRSRVQGRKAGLLGPSGTRPKTRATSMTSTAARSRRLATYAAAL